MITKDKIEEIIHLNGVIFVNDLSDNVDRNGFIEIIDKLHNIGINNQKIKVKVYCKECGKELIVRPSQYKKQKYFHCDQHIKHKPSGKDSPFYKQIEIQCTNCGDLYSVIPYDYNKSNRFGDNHNFCCQQCYWEYRSKYYINDKHSMFGTHQSDEQKQKQSELIAQMISSGVMPQTMTKPHKKINELLESNQICFENEYPAKYHSIDIFLSDYNLMIEIMGNYWHAHPLKYNMNELTQQQKKSIKQDKSKHTYVKKYNGVEILYLWEKDINENIDLCWLLIQKYIKNNGALDNYHSFNYHLDHNALMLNDILVTPFQEINLKDSLSYAI
jgi:G:T-mismatch repair DNA endonuclease (very short patch repair protein)